LINKNKNTPDKNLDGIFVSYRESVPAVKKEETKKPLVKEVKEEALGF